jgi:glycosyltransferase involved in cell wall biosynthesis
MNKKLSVVVTSYNEKENLERGVLDQMNDYLSHAKYTWEVIINDDGSTDGGDALIEKYVNKHTGFKMIRGKHGGKAAGIWNGIKEAEGEIVLFTDMDQSTPLKEVEKLLPWFDQGYDVVFGSRGSDRENFNLLRQLTSWGFRTIRGMLLLRDVKDTQCGFKAFKTPLAKRIFPHLAVLKKSSKSKGWTVSAFDVELLFMAEKTGAKLKEIPVIWKDEDTSTGKNRNFIKVSSDMLKQILQVKMNDMSGKYDKI